MDVDDRKLEKATKEGAVATVNARRDNVPDAVNRVTRTDRVGNNVGDRLLDGFTGLFGIDPLRPRR